MSIFVSKEPVAVTVDGQNVIYIRPKMGYGIEQKVVGEATKFIAAQKGSKAAEQTVEVNIGAYNLALLTNNILSWTGPEFSGIPCTPDNIAMLDDSEPLVELVLKEINDRNKGKGQPEEEGGAVIEGEYATVDGEVLSPNSQNGGGASSRAATKKMLATTTST